MKLSAMDPSSLVSDAIVLGAGPAGLRAAEVISSAGFSVSLIDAMPYPGRKFLVAGKGGLNLTHTEHWDTFVTRFSGSLPWQDFLAAFGPQEVLAWCKSLGVETYAGSSGRVFPVGEQAARLLKSWLNRLEENQVRLKMRHRFVDWNADGSLQVETPQGIVTMKADALVFALGGGSWPSTGSDGNWLPVFEKNGIQCVPLSASNCGMHVDWTPEFLGVSEGKPLKNLAVRVGPHEVRGELLVTRYGLEGGALYQLSGALRGNLPCSIYLDLKPEVSVEQLLKRFRKFRGKGSLARRASVCWKLCPVGRYLLQNSSASRDTSPSQKTPVSIEDLANQVKAMPLVLTQPRPIAEAISTAGGVGLDEVNQDLELTRRPGTFVAGEMLDWDAPTGGYLLTGCFSLGHRVGLSAVKRLRDRGRH